MKVTSATFGITHLKKSYMVDMTIRQDTQQNRREAIVTVVDTKGFAVLHETMSGRQLICQETAKRALKKALKENKIITETNPMP